MQGCVLSRCSVNSSTRLRVKSLSQLRPSSVQEPHQRAAVLQLQQRRAPRSSPFEHRTHVRHLPRTLQQPPAPDKTSDFMHGLTAAQT